MPTVGGDSGHARLQAAVESLRRDPCGAPASTSNRAHETGRSEFELPRGAENGWIGFGRSCQMDWHGFERSHLPHHAFFGAAEAGNARPDRPYSWNFVEVPVRAGGMRHWALAAELVKAPALAVTFIAKGGGKAARVEVGAPGAVLMNNAVVGELWPVVLIEFRETSHRHVLKNHCKQVVGIGRAAGKIDDRLAGDYRVDAHRSGGIRVGRWNSPPGGAGSHGDDGRGLAGYFFEYLDGRTAGQLHVDAVVASGNRAFDHEH